MANQLIDPNRNRMLTKDLGACDRGCKCQSKWLILWNTDADEIVEKEMISDHPKILEEFDKHIESGRYVELQDGLFKYGRTSNDWPYGLYPPEDENVPFKLDIVSINGKRYEKFNCPCVSEMNWSHEDQILEELKGKQSGYYVLLTEFACFTSYHWDYGEEGDSDCVVVVLNDEPILEDKIGLVDLDEYKVE